MTTDEGRPGESAADRRRTALHEAGHSVADVIFGRSVEYVSIRAGTTFSGISVTVPAMVPVDGFYPFTVVAEQPAELRADVERRVIATLTGDLAALYLASEPSTGYVDDTAETIARQALDTLGPRIAELVVDRETREEPFDRDEALAHNLARAFAGPEAGPHYLAWLRAEAWEFVIRYRHAILAVADALERQVVLGGEEVAALIRGAPPLV